MALGAVLLLFAVGCGSGGTLSAKALSQQAKMLQFSGRLGILERYGISTRRGGPGRPKEHGHPAIPWERVVRVGPEIVVRD
jgi:hypothetical protein